MATTTPKYDFFLPAVNDPIDEDLWGTQENTNGTSLDTILPAPLSNKYGAIAIQNSSDDGFEYVSNQGTSGTTILTSNGADAPPSFEPINLSSSWYHIQTQVASNSASIVFSTGIDSTYEKYVFFIENMTNLSNFNPSIGIEFSTDGGSSFLNTNYQYINRTRTSSVNFVSNSDNRIRMANAVANLNFYAPRNGVLWLHNPSSATSYKRITGNFMNMSYVSDTNSFSRYDYVNSHGGNKTISAINALRFTVVTAGVGETTTDTFDGKISLYGVRE